MPSKKNQHTSEHVTLRVAGLVIADEQKAACEKTAYDMADKVDAGSHLDPLDDEPAIRFDPRY